MPNTSPAESVLALFAGPARAAAIYGDLTEMAATRGTLWFLAAYARTLFSLTWRIVLALFVADVGRQLAFDTFHLYLRITPPAWRANTGFFVNTLNSSGPLLACIMSTLWFALFFALVRYGRRDPFVRLTALITAGAFLAFLAIPWISLAAAAATLALASAAFLSSRWRKPFEVLAWTGTAGLLALAAFTVLSRQFLLQHPAIAGSLASHPLALDALVFSFQGSLLLVAIVSSRLHKLLLEPPAPGSTAVAKSASQLLRPAAASYGIMGALPNFPLRDPDSDSEQQFKPGAPGPALLVRLEQPGGYASRAVPGARILPLRPYVVPREPTPLPSPRISPSFRSLLIFAACSLALAVLMAFILGFAAPRPATPRPVNPKLAPDAQTAAQTAFHTALQTSVQTNAVHPAKPSAYGEAFLPPRAAPRSHHASAATAAPPAAPTPATPSR